MINYMKSINKLNNISVKRLSLIFILSLMLFGCQDKVNNEKEMFNKYYSEFQKMNFADYDTLFAFYKKIDTLEDQKRSNLFLYLKRTTEGRLYFRKCEYLKSTAKYKEADSLIISDPANDSLVLKNLNAIGVNFIESVQYDSAFYYFQKALTLSEKMSDKSYQQTIQTNMALCYYNKDEVQKAITLIDQIIKNPASTSLEMGAYHLKANALGSSGSIDSAMILDRKILEKYKTDKKNYLISSFYNNLGMCYLAKNNIDSAIVYCKKSYTIDSLAGIKKFMGANLSLLGSIYSLKGQNDKAEQCYTEALNIFNDNQNLDNKINVYKSLARNALKKEQWQQAIVYKDSIMNLYKKTNNIELNRTIELLNIEYETSRKNQQIEIQNTKLNTQRYTILFILVFALLIVSLLYLYFQNRHKKNKIKMIEKEQKISSIVNEAEENLKAQIAQDLHDSVGQKLAVAQMHLSMINTENVDVVNNVSAILRQTTTDVREISHNLFPTDLNKGLLPALQHLCEQMNFVNAKIKTQLNIDETVANANIHKDIEQVIFRIIQEIINNAIKHSEADKININLSLKNNHISIDIADNGKGFDTDQIQNAKGIGVKTMMNRIHYINGMIKLNSVLNKGTSFYIEIPL